jgi:protein-tyrosine phosphatase
VKKVGDAIYQSDGPTAKEVCETTERWIELGIGGVVCPAFNVRVAYATKLAALILPIWDDSSVSPRLFDLACQFHDSFSPTLVHCAGGLNRSSAFAIALLIHSGVAFEEALSRVNARPHDNLMKSLATWTSTRVRR